MITVEEAKGMEMELEVVEGMQFDRGYLSPYFVTNPEQMRVELEDPYLLIHDKKISNMKDLLPILEKIAQMGKPLLIVAEDIDGEALATLVVNKLRGTLNVSAVKAPGFGDRRKQMLEDIAILTGGRVMSEDAGLKLENTTTADLGRCAKISIDKDNTTIIGGKGKGADVKARIGQIRTQIEDADIHELNKRFPIQFDLYTISFNEGRGGIAEPLQGASNNGMSNYFPRYSPDGKWIVYTRSRTGIMLQPDSELFIVPAAGGKARKMRCNRELFNSWHSFSPNGKWILFSSKANTPFTEIFLTHIDENGIDSPPVCLSRFSDEHYAANVPEFVNLSPGAINRIEIEDRP